MGDFYLKNFKVTKSEITVQYSRLQTCMLNFIVQYSKEMTMPKDKTSLSN